MDKEIDRTHAGTEEREDATCASKMKKKNWKKEDYCSRGLGKAGENYSE